MSDREPVEPSWLPLAAAAFALLVWGLTFASSDNLHSREESTSFDRLMLGLRWWEPDGSRWDLNFPLGTHVLMGLPQALGLDPVGWGRGLSAAAAAGAALLLFRILARVGGASLGAFGVAGLACIPGFVRGAVVVGEEAPYTALLLASLWALMRARDEARGGAGWLVAAIVAANATVLVRLDAMSALPGLVLAAGVLLGWRRAAVFALGSGLTSLLHLGLGWYAGGSWSGDPLGFAHLARATMEQSAGGFAALGPASLSLSLARELGGLPLLRGWPLFALAGMGIAWGLRRRDAPTRALAALSLWMLVIDGALVSLGAMEPRTVRYLVPLIVLLLGTGLAGLQGALPPSGRRASSVLVALGLLASLPRIGVEAQAAKLPTGIADAAAALGRSAGSERALVGEEHPTFVIFSGMPASSIDVLPAGSPQTNTADVVGDALERGGVRWLVQVSGNPSDSVVAELAAAGVRLEITEETACCRVWRVRE